jgi:hypothetical protein
MEMKNETLFAILFLASALVVLSHGPGKVAVGEDESATPASALRGNYADALHGSFALCLAPVSPFAEESCSTKGALVFPQSIVTAGHVTNGKNGSCETGTETVSDFPVDLSPPFVTALQTVGKSLDYDRNTGTRDASLLPTSEVNATGRIRQHWRDDHQYRQHAFCGFRQWKADRGRRYGPYGPD